MAGNGKETPRQKMINLMYLVLLALLALQVSSAIIQKFEYINSSLELANQEAEQRNHHVLQQIEKTVHKAKDAPEDVKILKKARETRNQTNELVSYIREIKHQLITETGGINEEGKIEGAKKEEPVAQLMIGPGETKKGEAYTLKERLNTQINTYNALLAQHDIDKTFDPIALDGHEDPVASDDPDQRNKDFAQLNFGSTPLVAALAVLSEKEARIMAIESEVLNELAQKVGAVNLPLDKVRPVVKPQSNMVVAGSEYKAEMFMAAYSSNFTPEMEANGRKLEVTPDGIGTVSFNPTASDYDKYGRARQKWKGTIRYPKPGGGDSLYTIEQDYYVFKPAIQVQASTVDQLYRKCANSLQVGVQGMGPEAQIKYRVEGGELIHGSGPGSIKIVPTEPEVKLKVYNENTYLGERKFGVQLIPKPEIKLMAGNREANLTQGESRSAMRNIRINIIPNDHFAKVTPEDAMYRNQETTVRLYRNGIMRGNPVTFSGNSHNLTNMMRQAEEGDLLMVEVKKVLRKNYRNAVEEADIGTNVFSVMLK